MRHPLLYVLLLCTLISCSRKSDKELFDEGKAAQAQQNFQLAIDRYQSVVDQFPKSAYAETSQYFAAIIYNNDLHDARKAISAYRKFYDIFPSSAEAANALFLVGFLYNNEVKNTDSARIAYELFLQKYPSHSLAVSAKFELETLGKDPTQVLQSQKTSATGASEQSGSQKE
ncbi:MAG TPA: tetratricopeptide repeat protein [Bacteroidota bacterium]|nr:tetratricopeptide repeat protein [Bacteroidota bacterium]